MKKQKIANKFCNSVDFNLPLNVFPFSFCKWNVVELGHVRRVVRGWSSYVVQFETEVNEEKGGIVMKLE